MPRNPLTQQEANTRVLQKHGSNLVIVTPYVNRATKWTLRCSRCSNSFETLPAHTFLGCGCPNCSYELRVLPKSATRERWTLERLIKEGSNIHENQFDYSAILEIHSVHQRVNLQCKICEFSFETRVDNHIYRKSGCPRCSQRLGVNFQDAIGKAKQIHGDLFEYTSNDSFTTSSKLEITCKSCHIIWNTKYHNHVSRKSGCPRCAKKRYVSALETAWLDSLDIPKEARNVFIKLLNRRAVNVDAFHNNIVYEFYGGYYHGDPRIYTSDVWNDRCQMTMGELYENTITRYNHLSATHNVKFVWELDFKSGLSFSPSHPSMSTNQKLLANQ